MQAFSRGTLNRLAQFCAAVFPCGSACGAYARAHDAAGKLGSPGGGVPATFHHTTHWSVVLAAADQETPEAAAALERLCRTYWNPLFAYVRREGHSPEDAQDLTQEFFASLGLRENLR